MCTLPCHWPRIESTNDCAPLRFIRSYHLSLRIFSFNFLRSKYSKRERSNVSPCEHFFEKEEKEEEEEKKDEKRGGKKKKIERHATSGGVTLQLKHPFGEGRARE